MDERILEDMVALCEGVLKNFDYEEWSWMTEEEKKIWCENFGLEHAHVIRGDEV